ncbi:MAG: LysM peptidoglycan-binding domain-containing protein [Sulfitobacter sp.]
MTNNSSKISFSSAQVGPSVAAEPSEPVDQQPFTATAPMAEPVPEQAPQGFKATSVHETVAPAYVTARTGGERFKPSVGFVQRNAMPIAVVSIVLLTFLLGVQTTLLLTKDEPQIVVAPQAVLPAPSAYVAVQNDDLPDLTDVVTRAAAPDLNDLGAVDAVQGDDVVANLAAAVLEGLHIQRTVGNLTADELAEKTAEAEAILNANKLRMLREGVLAGLYTIETSDVNGSKRIRLSTINAPLTTKAISSLLDQAAAEGRIDVPESLRNAEGGVDLETMMFNLVQTSLANDGTVEGAAAAREMSRQIFAASPVHSEEIGGKRTYVVEPGDSLAYIALQFYGKPGAFDRIFEANKETLQSPDKIQVGQRLIIPS